MLLSSYLLFHPEPNKIIDLFTSKTGRQFLEEALDDLTIIKNYANSYFGLDSDSKSIVYGLNVKEIMDMAYSYFVYKQTGECKKCSYTENPSDNGGFSYDQSQTAFNRKSVYDSFSDLDNAYFVIEEEFNIFVRDWIRNSKTLRPITKLKALGYTSDGSFGYNRVIIDSRKCIKLVSDKTILLLLAILKYVNSIDMNSDISISKIDNLIKLLHDRLSVPIYTRVVFGMNYNRLNRSTTKIKHGKGDSQSTEIVTTSQTLKSNQVKVLKNLAISGARANEYRQRIYNDCQMIFDSRFNNLTNNSLPLTVDGFKMEKRDWLLRECGVRIDEYTGAFEEINPQTGEYEEDNSLLVFISALYESMGINREESRNNIKSLSNSVMNMIKLYSLVKMIDFRFINSILDLDFSDQDYVNSTKELYEYFCIPFLSSTPFFDLRCGMESRINIAYEISSIEPPSDELIKFAFITAKTVASIDFMNKV